MRAERLSPPNLKFLGPVLAWISLWLFLAPAFAQARETGVAPFVGCRSDGQLGPRSATVQARAGGAEARRGRAAGILWLGRTWRIGAPRGWHCFGAYGSNGAFILVAPGDVRLDTANVKGPAIQLSLSDGGTSGRFEVAKVAARLFPTKRDFVDRVIAEKLEPAGDFPRGPYRHDHLKRISATDVEFQTPAEMEGMGTVSRLSKDSDPIDGFAKMTKDDSLLLLVVRLPASSRGLAPAIIAGARAQSRAVPL